MTIKASVYGSRIRVIASQTFPVGFDVTQFSDDSDPFDLPSIQIGDSGIGPNGTLIAWQKASVIKFSLSVPANSDDDKNLDVVFTANTPGEGKLPISDEITIVLTYRDGRTATLFGGICTNFMPSNSGTSEGRLKSKEYQFDFQGVVKN